MHPPGPAAQGYSMKRGASANAGDLLHSAVAAAAAAAASVVAVAVAVAVSRRCAALHETAQLPLRGETRAEEQSCHSCVKQVTGAMAFKVLQAPWMLDAAWFASISSIHTKLSLFYAKCTLRAALKA
eukprot:1159249-Pelagomonas_calceolata.AAC.5